MISFAQKNIENKKKLGPFSRSNTFTFSRKDKIKYGQYHRFSPKKDKTKAYFEDGSFIYLPKSAQLELVDIYKGEWDKKNGLWINPYISSDSKFKVPILSCYVFLGDLVSIEAKAKKADMEQLQAEKKLNSKKFGKNFISDLPYISIFIGFILILCILFFGTSQSNSSGINSNVNRTYSGSTSENSKFTDWGSSNSDHSTSTSSSSNSNNRFEYERRKAERASKIGDILYNSDMTSSDQDELSRLRRDQNADDHFNL